MAPAPKTYAQIAAVVTAYFIISIALVFSNKVLLSSSVSFAAPVFVTWFQCVLTSIIIYVLGVIGSNAANNSDGSASALKEFPSQTYDPTVAGKVFPLSLAFVGMITFNNLCLLYVEVSFYNVARSLTIVFNVIFTFLMLREKTSSRTLLCLALVIFGFLIGSDGELNFSLIGTVFGVLSSVFVSLNSIYTKKVMTHVNDDKWRLSFYNNVNASLFFLPLIFLFGEHHIISDHVQQLLTIEYWALMSTAGVLGFAIGIVTVMQINYTSPLTHNISGTAKACVQTILSLAIWPHSTTMKGNAGLALTILGSGLYAYVRMNESDRARALMQISVLRASNSSRDGEQMEEGGKSNSSNSSSNSNNESDSERETLMAENIEMGRTSNTSNGNSNRQP